MCCRMAGRQANTGRSVRPMLRKPPRGTREAHIQCTINEGDPCVALVQPVYLAQHQGGAVHTLVIASFHGVRRVRVCVCVCVCV